MGSSWSGPSVHQRRRFTDEEMQVILNEVEHRALSTPSIYDLEDLLRQLRRRHPVEVWWLRHYLKWMMKRCHQELGVDMLNPYWQSKKSRLR